MLERKKLSDILSESERKVLEGAWLTTTAAPDHDPDPDRKPIPTGKYPCRVINGGPFVARTGNKGYKLTFEGLEGPYAGRRLWHDHWFTEKALPMTKRDLAKLGINHFEQLDVPLREGIIVSARVTLK